MNSHRQTDDAEGGGDPHNHVSVMTTEAATTDDNHSTHNNYRHNNTSQSVVSGLSGTVASKKSVWSQAAAILRGELPEQSDEDDDNKEDLLVGREIVGGVSREDNLYHNNITSNGTNGMPAASPITTTLPATTTAVMPAAGGLSPSSMQSLLSPTILEVLDASERLARERSSAFVATSSTDSSFINFLEDDPRTMTYSRRLALFLMRRYAWYNPHLEKKTAAATEEAADDDDAETPAERPESNEIAAAPTKTLMQMVDSYPFTHSKRERPSLEKAWA